VKSGFTAFAIEDKNFRAMLVGQRLHTDTPFELSVKEPWDEQWSRTRIKRCDGVIGIITKKHTKGGGSALGAKV
jgi:hypothetical protein